MESESSVFIGDAISDRAKLRAAIERIKEHRHGAHLTRQDRFKDAFDSARKRIRTRVLGEFRQHEWPRFQMLDEIFQKGLGLPIPTLSVCGEGTAEVRFTKLLAYFFDSRNNHGLGGLLARAVFAEEIEEGARLHFEECTAESEVSLGASPLSDGQQMQNSLDILIHLREHNNVREHKILIEQKITSTEGKEQLSRYSDAMKKKFPADTVLHCFYLTPEGRKGKEEEWWPLSHSELFCRMASLLERHALSPAARHNLRAFLWDLMLGPLAQDRQWMDELKQQVDQVAKDYKKYIDLKNWFERHGMGRDELRMLAKIVVD
jgi:hypothetical protein